MNYLNADFLSSKGILATKPLKDWLTRVSFVAKTRGSPTETERYAKWALCVIEDHLANHSVNDVDWKSVPTVMAAKADAREPRMLSSTNANAETPQQTTVDYRAELYRESVGRAPPELRKFLNRAFELYDKDVAKGKRQYKQVSFMEMLNIARNLEKREQSEKAKAALHLSEKLPVSLTPSTVDKPTVLNRNAGFAPVDKRKRVEQPPLHSSAKNTAMPDGSQDCPHNKRVRAEHASATAQECAAFFRDIISKDDTNTGKGYRVFTAKSTELERRYSRYEPTEEDIRPLHVLDTSFKFIVDKSRAKEKQENRSNALKYLSDQLKGMRQDLRVQNIVNDFTVMVYEFHARICLEAGDIGEFNQCQASLKGFYEHRSVDKGKCHMAEFFVYRIVYLSLSKQYDSLSTELIEYTNTRCLPQCAAMRKFLPTPERMQQVLQLIVALDNGDALSAFQILFLFKRELQFLLQIYLPRMRVYWLYNILCGIRGKISLRFIMSNLGFLPVVHKDGNQKAPAELLWADGDKEMAEAKLRDLFVTLKISLPTEFAFEKELVIGRSTGVSLDASVALRQVEEYIQYLGTRNDAQI